VAFKNLYSACCSMSEGENNCAFKDEKSEVFPTSPFLADHFLDI
jgi:hypothetical protein